MAQTDSTGTPQDAGSSAAPAADPQAHPSERAVVAHHDDEGNTPAAWTACGGLIVATAVGGIGIVIGSWLLVVVGAVIAVAGLIAGNAMSRASGRNAPPARPEGQSVATAAGPTGERSDERD